RKYNQDEEEVHPISYLLSPISFIFSDLVVCFRSLWIPLFRSLLSSLVMMMRTVSLPLSHHKIHQASGYHNVPTCVNYHLLNSRSIACKNRVYLTQTRLSSFSTRRDVWSLQLFETLRGFKAPVSSCSNAFVCRAALFPGGGSHGPIVKSTALVLTRPLMGLTRATLFESTWYTLILSGRNFDSRREMMQIHKRAAHNTLLCHIFSLCCFGVEHSFSAANMELSFRTLDPVVLSSSASQAVKTRFLSFAQSMSTVLAFACCLSSLLQQVQKFFMETNNPADTRNFCWEAVYTAAWVAAASLFMELLGFSTQKWLTAGGLGTHYDSCYTALVLNEWIQTKIGGYEVSGTVELSPSIYSQADYGK
ncbi:hypothetical protein HID58_090207, partial [Brassica napus]